MGLSPFIHRETNTIGAAKQIPLGRKGTKKHQESLQTQTLVAVLVRFWLGRLRLFELFGSQGGQVPDERDQLPDLFGTILGPDGPGMTAIGK
jgi:hypothetical protein